MARFVHTMAFEPECEGVKLNPISLCCILTCELILYTTFAWIVLFFESAQLCLPERHFSDLFNFFLSSFMLLSKTDQSIFNNVYYEIYTPGICTTPWWNSQHQKSCISLSIVQFPTWLKRVVPSPNKDITCTCLRLLCTGRDDNSREQFIFGWRSEHKCIHESLDQLGAHYICEYVSLLEEIETPNSCLPSITFGLINSWMWHSNYHAMV